MHRVHGVGDEPAVSIHAYSPPLQRLGVYEAGADGALRRETVSASHELRAADPSLLEATEAITPTTKAAR